MGNKLGSYIFLLGIAVAIILGIAGPSIGSSQAWLTSLLVLLGLLAGYLNVSRKEAKSFTLLATLLAVAAYTGNASGILAEVQFIGGWLMGIMDTIMAFIVPAAIVAALKGIWEIGAS